MLDVVIFPFFSVDHYEIIFNHASYEVEMTPDEADAIADRLKLIAAKVRALNFDEPKMAEQASGCKHTNVIRGGDVPRVYGSFRSQVCIDCGAFRTHNHNEVPDPLSQLSGHPWRPASEYADAISREED